MKKTPEQIDFLINFGKLIRDLRNDQQLSQENLADLCNLHRTYVSDLERGTRNVSLCNLFIIASALNTNLSQIFSLLEDDYESQS